MGENYRVKAGNNKTALALRAVVIDDDPGIVSKVSAVIAETEGVTLFATADSCATGATIISDHNPQILFLKVLTCIGITNSSPPV